VAKAQTLGGEGVWEYRQTKMLRLGLHAQVYFTVIAYNFIYA